MNLSNAVKITKVVDQSSAAGTSSAEGAVIDMANYDGCLFMTSFPTAAANNGLKCKMSSASDTGTQGDIEGSATASGASDEDHWLDVYRPRKRYLQVVVVRGTSSKLGDVWALQYKGNKRPEDNVTTGTITGEVSVSASTGTA